MRSRTLFVLCFVVAPLVLLGIELFHPANFTDSPGAYQYLSQPEPYDPAHDALAYPGPEWWFRLHMIQTPLVGLVAVGLSAGLCLAAFAALFLLRPRRAVAAHPLPVRSLSADRRTTLLSRDHLLPR